MVEIVSFTAVDDFGNIINPMIVEGQVHGGIAQGVGQALFESAVYDKETGQLLTGSYMDYCHAAGRQRAELQARCTSTPCTAQPAGGEGLRRGRRDRRAGRVMNARHRRARRRGVDDAGHARQVWQAIQDGPAAAAE